MPHDEHLIVGRNADSLSPDMTARQCLLGRVFRVVDQKVLFEREGTHWICRHRHVLRSSHRRSAAVSSLEKKAAVWVL